MAEVHPPHLPPALHCGWLPYARGEAAEAQVRAWAAATLGCPPAALQLVRDRHGRPRLNAPSGLDLNWSHSGDGLLVALGDGIEVGVDLERERPRPRALELAQRFFHPAEAAWLSAQPAAQREPAFLRLWCAKEAVLKAHGRGIAFGLHRFALRDAGDGLAIVEGDAELRGPWSLREWRPQPGYFAALAWRPA
jgi:4'-phosphopantetheinyl transferase